MTELLTHIKNILCTIHVSGQHDVTAMAGVMNAIDQAIDALDGDKGFQDLKEVTNDGSND